MTRSILSLPPVLQDVWRTTYASIVGGYQPPNAAESVKEVSQWAEDYAWEAVLRANGGEMPDSSDDGEEMLEALILAVETALFAFAASYEAGSLTDEQRDALDELEKAQAPIRSAARGQS